MTAFSMVGSRLAATRMRSAWPPIQQVPRSVFASRLTNSMVMMVVFALAVALGGLGLQRPVQLHGRVLGDGLVGLEAAVVGKDCDACVLVDELNLDAFQQVA